MFWRLIGQWWRLGHVLVMPVSIWHSTQNAPWPVVLKSDWYTPLTAILSHPTKGWWLFLLIGHILRCYMVICTDTNQALWCEECPKASISQDYWGRIKEDWGSGGWKSPSGSRGGATVGGLGDEAQAFFVKLHIIFALKYKKQQLLLLLDKINLA